jgi:endogenous inhibitor of DNA gyrase (YacG/DUF329 family)
MTSQKTHGDNRATMIISCPVCKKKTAWKDNPFRPFCSERCRLIDLGQWAAEEYRIAGEKNPLPEEGEHEKNSNDK